MKYVLYTLLGLLTYLPNAMAEGKRHGPEAIEVKIEVGTKDGQMKFVPNQLKFERGKYYKLVIHNPSQQDHYFSSDAFGTHIFTRKVEVANKEGRTLVEIHGDIHDLELKPDTTVEWFFYPMTKGKDLKLYCHKDDHETQGMVGSIEISGPPPFPK